MKAINKLVILMFSITLFTITVDADDILPPIKTYNNLQYIDFGTEKQGSYTLVIEQGLGSAIKDWAKTITALQLEDEYRTIIYQRPCSIVDAVVPTAPPASDQFNKQAYEEYAKQVATYEAEAKKQYAQCVSQTTTVPDEYFNLDNSNARLKELLDELSVSDNVIVIAHSYGGLLARQFIVNYPDEAKGLILLDPSTEYMLQTVPPAQQSLAVNSWKANGPDGVNMADVLEDTHDDNPQMLDSGDPYKLPIVVLNVTASIKEMHQDLIRFNPNAGFFMRHTLSHPLIPSYAELNTSLIKVAEEVIATQPAGQN